MTVSGRAGMAERPPRAPSAPHAPRAPRATRWAPQDIRWQLAALTTTAMPHPRHGHAAWSDSAGNTLLRAFPPAWLWLGRLYPLGGAAGLVRQRDLGDIGGHVGD